MGYPEDIESQVESHIPEEYRYPLYDEVQPTRGVHYDPRDPQSPRPVTPTLEEDARHPMLYIPPRGNDQPPMAHQLSPVREEQEPMIHSPHSASTASPHSSENGPYTQPIPQQSFNGFPGVPLACTCCDDPGTNCDGNGGDELNESSV